MVAITSQKQRRSQPPRWGRWTFAIFLLAIGCSPSAEEQVRGAWVGDAERMAKDPFFDALAGRAGATARAITQTAVSRVTVELGEETCSASTMGTGGPWPCRVVRTEPKEVVVYHLDLPEGRRILRIQPTPSGAEMTWWNGRKMALRRP